MILNEITFLLNKLFCKKIRNNLIGCIGMGENPHMAAIDGVYLYIGKQEITTSAMQRE